MLLSEIDEYSVKILVSIGVNARSKFNSYNRLEIGRLPDHLSYEIITNSFSFFVIAAFFRANDATVPL